MNPGRQALHDGDVKSLFAKIMLAQAATVVLALLVVFVLTRVSLNRGFFDFVEGQETGVLHHLAPLLADVYAEQGGWDFLREEPENWHRILRRSRQLDGKPGMGRRPPGAPDSRRHPPPVAPPGPLAEEGLLWLRTFDRLGLRERLFLLDEDRRPLAGAHAAHWMEHGAGPALEPIISDGATVGWVGFEPVRRELPMEVQRFLHGQVRAHLVALVAALSVVTLLAYALARHLSRPVAHLDETVSELSRGEFEKRAVITSGDEIGRLAQNVNRLAETLERNRSARHRWMTDIAHELRTPVAILKGEIEALRDGLRPADERTFNSLSEEIDHLSILVDDLQSLALADAGALNLHLRPADLRELIQQACEAFADRFRARDIEIEMISPDGPVTVNVDSQRIRQLLNNLLENCARYADQGGQVRLSLSARDEGAEVAVEDSGPGVTPEIMERLFERFFRAEAGRSRAGGGSGLGLSICKSIVEAHGGSIQAFQSELGGLGINLMFPN